LAGGKRTPISDSQSPDGDSMYNRKFVVHWQTLLSQRDETWSRCIYHEAETRDR